MTGLVRILLAAPVAWLVAWLAAHGIGADPDLVASLLGAGLGAVLLGGLHWAEHRWPAVRRLVAWLAQRVPSLSPSSSPPARTPLTSGTSLGGDTGTRTAGAAHVTVITPSSSPAATPPAGPPAGTPPASTP